MGNNVITWGCCKSSFHLNRSDEYEIKKNDKSDRYPVFLNDSASRESNEKGYIYVPEDISSIDFPYFPDDPAKGLKPSNPDLDEKNIFPASFSLGTIKEVSNSEGHDLFSSDFLNTQELLRKELKTSQNISKVLDFKLSDSYSCRESEFDEKLGIL
jgi:hypothetical protein